MKIQDEIELKWNIEIVVLDRGKQKIHHQNTHNIVVNTGRQMMAENMTASAFGPGTFVRHQDSVVRYIGFGVGGSRQNNPAALAAPLSTAYPTGYGGTNTQTDDDVTVSRLERPVAVTASPLWMREISTPGTFPTARSTRYIATFSETDLNIGAFTSVPLSEIALFKSSANPALPNGSSGTYPGAGAHTVAYDTFEPFSKTGAFVIEVRWELRF